MNNDYTELQKEYEILEGKYSYLASVLVGVFEDRIKIRNIGDARVEYRIKSYESFLDKIQRKSYQFPFVEINDFCGFRIILKNHKDVPEIVSVLEKSFDVIESIDKNEELQVDQFGYRSHHMVVRIKKDWLASPQYWDSEDLRIEFQIRTELMNAWANLSHQLFYKREANPPSVRRRLARLSAVMELADSEITQIFSTEAVGVNRKRKIKALQDVLDLYLPDRKKSPENPVASLIQEMEIYNFSLETLVYYLKTKLEKLKQIEIEAFAELEEMEEVESRWWQLGIVRGFMYLTIKDYWLKMGTKYSPHFVKIIEFYQPTFLNENYDENENKN